jgi:hypothetical protein
MDLIHNRFFFLKMKLHEYTHVFLRLSSLHVHNQTSQFFFPIMYTYGSTIESYICARVGFPIDLAMPEVK